MRSVKKTIGLLAVLLVLSVFGGHFIAKADTAKDLTVTCYPDCNIENCVYLTGKDATTVPGISWDADKGILTLNGYNGGCIDIWDYSDTARYDNLVDIEVRIIGENTVHGFKSETSQESMFALSGVNCKLTGTGTLTVESMSNGYDVQGITVYGNLTIDGPTIILPSTSDAVKSFQDTIKVYEDDDDQPDDYIDVGGELNIKSGTIKMYLRPVKDQYYDDEQQKYIYSLYLCFNGGIFSQGTMTIEGGTFIFDINWPDQAQIADIDYVYYPECLFVSETSIDAKNATIVRTTKDIIPDFPEFVVVETDEDGYWIYKDGKMVTVPTAVKKDDSSITVIKGKRGEKIDIGKTEITLSQNAFVYDGNAKTPVVNVKGFKEGTDYTVAFTNNVNVGTATATVTGIGDYTGTVAINFTIAAPNKGTTFVNGNYKYKITKAAAGSKAGAVTLVGPVKKTLKTIVVPDAVNIGVKYNVTAIGPKAFMNNKKATKITIGKNVTNIGANAFAGCKKAKTYVIKSAKIKKIGAKAFNKTKKGAKFKVPKKKIKKYRKMIIKAKAKAPKVTK